jgi:uncharacterized membrane protein YeaQ/YmgE (transglycosylase-associated protein family)
MTYRAPNKPAATRSELTGYLPSKRPAAGINRAPSRATVTAAAIRPRVEVEGASVCAALSIRVAASAIVRPERRNRSEPMFMPLKWNARPEVPTSWQILPHRRAPNGYDYGAASSAIGLSETPMSIIAWIVLGLIAGFIGSKIVNKRGEGLLRDIILGVIGAVVGGWLFHVFGAAGVTGLNLYSLLVAVVGAIVVLVIYHALTGRKSRA